MSVLFCEYPNDDSIFRYAFLCRCHKCGEVQTWGITHEELERPELGLKGECGKCKELSYVVPTA